MITLEQLNSNKNTLCFATLSRHDESITTLKKLNETLGTNYTLEDEFGKGVYEMPCLERRALEKYFCSAFYIIRQSIVIQIDGMLYDCLSGGISIDAKPIAMGYVGNIVSIFTLFHDTDKVSFTKSLDDEEKFLISVEASAIERFKYAYNLYKELIMRNN